MVGVASSAHASADDDARIYGGEPTNTCEWPNTIGFGGCSGTLIHPRVVIYAAHCGASSTNIQFGEQYQTKISRTVRAEFCTLGPDWVSEQQSLGKGVDFAFCYLSEAVEDVPIAPIAYGCELDQVVAGSDIYLVGFGNSDNGSPRYGVKRKVLTDLVRLTVGGKEVEVGSGGKTACNGDSGGPAFIKLSDGTWRTFGITSWGQQPCGGTAHYTMANIAVPWIHQTLQERGVTDVDITPCYNDNGDWEPNDECTEFAMDPGTAHGSWADGCSDGAPVSGPSTICAPPDETPPTVEITDPESGLEVEFGGSFEVTVDADDESGIAPEVTLYVDGNALDAIAEAPYAWTIDDLDPGMYEIYAKAVDAAGNEASSDSIEVTMLEEEMETPQTEDPKTEDPETEDPGDTEDESEDSSDEDGSSDSSDESSTDEDGTDDEDDEDDESGSDSEKEDDDKDDDKSKDPGADSKKNGGCSVRGQDNETPWLAFVPALLGLTWLRRRRRTS